MARFSLNSNNINPTNSLTIKGIKVYPDLLKIDSSTTPLSLINAKGDLDGDGKKDVIVQSLLLKVPSKNSESLAQENFILTNKHLSPGILNLADIKISDGFFRNNSLSLFYNFTDINGDNFNELLITLFSLEVQNSKLTVRPSSTVFILENDEFVKSKNLQSSFDSGKAFRVTDRDNEIISFSAAGDINNDDINDFAFASHTTEDSEESINKIVFGLESYTPNLDISTLDGSNGFTVDSNKTLEGIHLDINNDRFDDLIFTSNDNPTGYVVFGREKFPSELDLDNLTSEEGFSIVDQNSNKSDRFDLGFTKDINGDGISDIVIQKNIQIENSDGVEEKRDRVFVIYGREDNALYTIDLADLNGSNGFTIDSATTLQSIIDINGDNLQDAFVFNPIENKTYVIFGSENIATNVDPNNLNGTNGFVIENTNINPQLSNKIAVSGDVNGDNITDLVIDNKEGNTHILLGSKAPFPASIDLTDESTNAIAISGDKTVRGIADLSDINGDGADDIIFNSVIDSEDNTSASTTIVYGNKDLDFDRDNQDSTIELYRFRNNSFNTGTYVFVDAAERDFILNDENLSQTFSLDGVTQNGAVNPAFKASTTPGEGLIPFFRLKSLDVPGTFLFVSTAEYNTIFAADSDLKDKWEKEGFDDSGDDIAEFYLMDGSTDRGIEFNRFQNKQNGTFLYAGEAEATAIENDPNLSNLFNNQGAAFDSFV